MFFFYLIAIILGLNSVKDLTVTKFDKKSKFEGVWGELEVENCFQRQTFTKYLKQTPAFM